MSRLATMTSPTDQHVTAAMAAKRPEPLCSAPPSPEASDDMESTLGARGTDRTGFWVR